jgi:hypothetical protein
MGFAGKKVEHALSIGFIPRFAEDFAVHDDDRVGGQHKSSGLLTECCPRFFPSQALGAIASAFSGLRFFRNIGGKDGEWNTCVAQ